MECASDLLAFFYLKVIITAIPVSSDECLLKFEDGTQTVFEQSCLVLKKYSYNKLGRTGILTVE